MRPFRFVGVRLVGVVVVVVVFGVVGPLLAVGAGSGVLVGPVDGAVDVGVDPVLGVLVSGPDGATLDVSFYGREVPAGESFTFVALPDTQHYSDSAVDHVVFGAQTQWVVEEREDLNIVLVAHLGDIVENQDSMTEWMRADTHLGVFDDGEIPVAISTGNHDMDLVTGTASLYDIYLPPSRYQGHRWYGGYLGEDLFGPDPVDRLWKNNFELFSAGGIDFVSIALEYGLPQYSLDWAATVLDTYPDRHAILTTHAFLAADGTRPSFTSPGAPNATSPEHAWNTLVRSHCNVFLVLNGHHPGEAQLTSVNNCGRKVHQLLADYQSRPNGGDGWLRYMTLNPTTNTIDVFTYSPTRNAGTGDYETDPDSQFTLTVDLGFTPIGTQTINSGDTTTITWPGRAPNTSYQWYAIIDDGTHHTRTNTWTFHTTTTPTCNGLTVTIDMNTGAPGQGTPETDVILGTAGADMISGLGGNDTICGGDGADIINGGNGTDRIFGGPGADVLGGQGGADELHGERGNDRVNGGVGDDVIWGGPGNDDLRGQGDDDTMWGESGIDQFYGGSGNDVIHTGSGGNAGTLQVVRGQGNNDVIVGGAGRDDLEGGPGFDEIRGGDGNDQLSGGNAADILFGDAGVDALDGEGGADSCDGGPGIGDTAAACETIVGVP